MPRLPTDANAVAAGLSADELASAVKSIFEPGPVSIMKEGHSGRIEDRRLGRRREPHGSARRSLRGVLEGDGMGNDEVFP